ncbi:MAG TPA: hypothetical protein VF275_04380 [Gammaproteobacteria bacterium]
MRARLHFDRVAPGGITLPFLLVAPFLGLLAVGLLLYAGDIVLASRWHPALIGALHIYTIGFLLFTIAGVLLQIGPVLSARPALQDERVAARLRFVLGTGAVLLGCGLFHSMRVLLIPGVTLLALGLSAWLPIAIRGIGIARPTRALLIALTGLGIGAILGLRLALGHAFPSLGLPRHWTNIHAGWMLLGGIAPLVMAIGAVVIPMFQQTPVLPRFTKLLPATAFTGMLIAMLPRVAVIGWALAALALAVFAIVVLRAQTRRRNAGSDPTVALFRQAMLAALAGIIAWSAALVFPEWQHRLQWTGAVLLIAGFAGGSVHGMMLKIVPFLVRLRLQRTLWEHSRPALNLPAFQQLLPRKLSRAIAPLHGSAVVLLTIAAVTPNRYTFLAAMTLLGTAQLALGITAWSAVLRGAQFGAQTVARHDIEENTT